MQRGPPGRQLRRFRDLCRSLYEIEESAFHCFEPLAYRLYASPTDCIRIYIPTSLAHNFRGIWFTSAHVKATTWILRMSVTHEL